MYLTQAPVCGPCPSRCRGSERSSLVTNLGIGFANDDRLSATSRKTLAARLLVGW